MSESLAVGAARLCGLMCRTLGWRPQHFWDATPAEIAAIYANPDGTVDDALSRAEFDKLMEQDQHG